MKAEVLLDLHSKLSSQARDIMKAKNNDYTSGSGDPFANFRGSTMLGIHPVLGMQMRQMDKMMRVRTFVEKGELQVKGEGILDAVLDQINYLVLQYAFIQDELNNKEEVVHIEEHRKRYPTRETYAYIPDRVDEE